VPGVGKLRVCSNCYRKGVEKPPPQLPPPTPPSLSTSATTTTMTTTTTSSVQNPIAVKDNAKSVQLSVQTNATALVDVDDALRQSAATNPMANNKKLLPLKKGAQCTY